VAERFALEVLPTIYKSVAFLGDRQTTARCKQTVISSGTVLSALC